MIEIGQVPHRPAHLPYPDHPLRIDSEERRKAAEREPARLLAKPPEESTPRIRHPTKG